MTSELIIAAGAAFGSGAHPTTHLCLEALHAIAQARISVSRVLDVGCGSCILSIAAAQHWVNAQIFAVDLNPEAIEFLRHNATLNHVSHERITFFHSDGVVHKGITRHAPYDVIMCNISAQVIVPLLQSFGKLAHKDTILVLSGILQQHQMLVEEALSYAGWNLMTVLAQKEWRAMITRYETFTD